MYITSGPTTEVSEQEKNHATLDALCDSIGMTYFIFPVAVELYIGALETTPPAKPVLTE